MDTQAADGILEPLQYVHVQLQGGAPWGFTIQGGLEHGGPLIISKIEDGGKAAKCEKIEVGDELVNINGTPLHGSRQEALVLIKGSYKILRMIVRRRSVLVIRPHSWHLAKLSEVHPDVASMQYPSDAFSMSWHSGSEISEHPLQWSILSRHCSTDKSSSIGSMESLDQPGQNYYEGTNSPLDPGMYQNKRDSAYSSFSASSNISDYTVSARMDESSPINCFLGSNKQDDSQYLQTGQEVVQSQVNVSRQLLNGHFQKGSIFPYDTQNLDNRNSAPQPPIRRDSLKENKNTFCNRDRRSSAPSDSFAMLEKWSSEAGRFHSSENAFCQCTDVSCTAQFKENLSSDQYYMLSSQTNKVYQINKFAKDNERQNNHCTEDNRETKIFHYNNINEVPYKIDHMAPEAVQNPDSEHWKALCHHSTQTNKSSVQACFRSDLQSTSEDCCYPTDKCKEENEKRYKSNANKDFKITQQCSTEQPIDTNSVHLCSSLDGSVRVPNEAKYAPSSQSSYFVDALNSSIITSTVTQDASGQGETVSPIKKSGSTRHRSAQMRRKSDRFATNLRNEIQRRKAQLQKNESSKVLLSGEECVEEADKTFENHSELIPPPPPPKNKTLLLEIKRVNAEKCRSSKEYLNQEKQQGELTDKKSELHKHTIKENIPLIKKACTEDGGLFLPSQNKTYNKWWKSNASETRQQDSHIELQMNIEQKCSYTTRDFHQAIHMAPKSESFLNKSAPDSTNKLSSKDMWNTEDEISTSSLKIPVECIDSSGPEQKPSTEVCSANTLKIACASQPLTETLDKHTHVDNICNMNNQFYDSERHLIQFTNEQPVRERKIICQANLEQEKKVHDIRNLDEFSATAQLSPQQFSEFKNHISQHNVNDGATWKCFPEHQRPTHSYIAKEIGHKLNEINLEELVPPITRMSDENILMPFADRRRFFEDVSKGPSCSFTVNDDKQNKNFFPSVPDNNFSQTMFPDLRRHSVDHKHYNASARRQDSGLHHYDFCINHTVDPPMCSNQGKLTDYLPSFTYGCRACSFCSNDLCPALLKRNLPVNHHSCHCQCLHQHHHHRWTKCADYLCPTHYNSLEDSGSLHVDRWHIRKPLSQDISLKEWNQHLKINRKCSQSVSDLSHFLSGIEHPGSLKSCCEEDNHEFPECYKTTSSYDLSCENLLRPVDFASFQHDHPEPFLSRNRAYSVNQLNLEYLALRDRMESPTTKLEEKEPFARSKKQGPPRPPPPKWEKYKELQASKQTTKSGLLYCNERSVSELNRVIKDARQRSPSLPVDGTSFNTACNLSPSPIHGLNHIKELSELRCASQGFQESSPASPPSQKALITSECTEADGHDTIDPLFCSESITMEPPALEDIFEGDFRCLEDDWSSDRESEVSIPERYDEFQPISPIPLCGTVSTTTYFNTSAANAEKLNIMKEMAQEQEKNENMTEAEDEENELTFKKVQLIESISRKLSVLHEAQQGLQEDISSNAILGCELENLLKNVCKPNEYDKFRILIGDLDKVVNLLWSLSGRLSRVESALNCEDPEPSMEEKLNLMEKKKQLTDQLEDAKELKAHVTRREKIVLETISKYLNDEQLQDYHYYVKMTSALIVEQRELEDKIRLGEEQLRCLRESL